MSLVQRMIPGLKDSGLSTSQYVAKRLAEAGADEEVTRLMIEQDVAKYVAVELALDNVPTTSDFQRAYPAWESEDYIGIIESAIEVEKVLQTGRRRTF